MLPERKGNRQQSQVQTTKARELGWTPVVSLEDHIREFRASCKQEIPVEKRILVFSTTFFPVQGPAEKALLDLMREMKDVQFDVITTKYDQHSEQTSLALPNVVIHRIGNGSRFDKYRLMSDGYK